MSDLLPFLIVGLTRGSVYGLAGLGLVLTFKTSGIFNFAHGGVAAAAVYAFYDLHNVHGLPWPIAAAICVFVLAPLVAILLERLSAKLATARPVMAIVAMVGLLVFIQGFLSWKYSPLTLDFPSFLPAGTIHIAGVNVRYDQVITMVVGLLSATGLYVFFRISRLGMAMRGVVDDPSLVALTGERPSRVRGVSWMLGCAFAALSGLLIGPLYGRDPFLLNLLVIQAFGAAAVGAFSNLPATYMGGLGVGILAALTTKYVPAEGIFAGLPVAIPFLVLFAALLVTPSRRLGLQVEHTVRTSGRLLPKKVSRAVTVVLAGSLFAAPAFANEKLLLYTAGLVFVLVFLSLGILVWTSGQISLCHAVFVAAGATTFSHLSHDAGIPWVAALVAAGLAAIPLGALIAIPAIRLHGVYLALATFGFGLLMERVVFRSTLMFGEAGFISGGRPVLGFLDGRSDRPFYYVVLLTAFVATIAVVAIMHSRLGRLLRALADAPIALTTHGLNVNLTRVLVFCFAAFLAGIAGGLLIATFGQVNAASFTSFHSLLWPTILAVCGASVLRSSLLAAFVLVVLPAYLPPGFSAYREMVFGASALLVAAFVIDRRITNVGERTRERLTTGPLEARMVARSATATVP
jgi:branched-subunit amino acid ABC-type transport system permease component